MSRFPSLLALSGVLLLTGVGGAAGQDAAAGEKVFARCKACHAVGEGAGNKVGPQLNDLFGRQAGTAEGFRYSKAMADAGAGGLVWHEESIKAYLADPRGFVKGNKMAFAGLKKEAELADIVAYLATFSAPQEESKVQEEAPAEQGQGATAEGGPAASGGGTRYRLGRLAGEDEIRAWDIDVRPDGLGLPEGRGTVAEGQGIFDENCAACHGDFGEAIGRWPMLAGGHGTLQDERPVKTIGSYWPFASTIYDYVRRAMPFGNARSLSDDDVYALTAYLLYLNDVVTDEEFELSKENFTEVELPNEANFVEDDREAEAHNRGEGEPCMTDCRPGRAEITMHAAVLDVTPQGGEDEPAGSID